MDETLGTILYIFLSVLIFLLYLGGIVFTLKLYAIKDVPDSTKNAALICMIIGFIFPPLELVPMALYFSAIRKP